jgi:hypothetical protein
MTHAHDKWHRTKLVAHVALVCTLLIAAAAWLTIYLFGTLGTSPGRGGARATAARAGGTAQEFSSVLALTERKVQRFLGEWEFAEPHLPGHFHHIGRWYQLDQWNFCVDCHGQTPHSRKPQVRAFLNMHNLFITCQVCHAPAREQPARFGWAALADGAIVPNPAMTPGVWGEYDAKITALEGPPESPRPFVLAEEKAEAAEFTAKMNGLSGEQRAQGNKRLHRRCAQNPLTCAECHKREKPFLPLADLGYAQERADFLVSAEVVDLVQRYEEFHLPKLLDPTAKTPKAPDEKQ